jgi:hypothetical protein
LLAFLFGVVLRLWVKLVFALAAFAQFHLLDIHLFPDGNGRISRLVSKHILDSVMVFPFPMFEDREVYLSTLTNRDGIDAPKELMRLMLDEALTHYKTLE